MTLPMRLPSTLNRGRIPDRVKPPHDQSFIRTGQTTDGQSYAYDLLQEK